MESQDVYYPFLFLHLPNNNVLNYEKFPILREKKKQKNFSTVSNGEISLPKFYEINSRTKSLYPLL